MDPTNGIEDGVAQELIETNREVPDRVAQNIGKLNFFQNTRREGSLVSEYYAPTINSFVTSLPVEMLDICRNY